MLSEMGEALREGRFGRPQARRNRRAARHASLGVVFLGLALVVGCLLQSRPARADQPDPDPWFGRDKALHFGASAIIAGGSYGVGRALFDKRRDAILFGSGVGIAVGAAKETWDALGHGDPSWKDFTWDVAGTAVGVALAWGLDLLVSHFTATNRQTTPDPTAAPAR